MRVLHDVMREGKGKAAVSTTRTSIRKLREYMQAKDLPDSPEVAAEWLEKEIRPISVSEIYKRMRFVHYKIAALFSPGENFRELFYKDFIQSDYDRLPFWAQELVSKFLAYSRSRQKCITNFKSGSSKFMLSMVSDGMDSITSLSHESCATYYKKYGTVKGVGRFLAYLESQELVDSYIGSSCHRLFSRRVQKVPEDSPLRRCYSTFSLQQYKAAQTRVYKTLIAQTYSSTIKKGFLSAANEFGIFLGINGIGYSEDAVSWFIENFKHNISPNTDSARRALLSIGYFLNHPESKVLPLVFPSKRTPTSPSWADPEVSAYREIRKSSGKCKSTLDMDWHALTRFLLFLDTNGCHAFRDVSAEMIKDFNTQDLHSTNEGKNAYNVRIRGFLRFLESRNRVPNGISKALPSVNGTKARPTTILSSEDQESIKVYCEKAELSGKLLEAAVLKIATQTGLRGIDIARLRCDAIDWITREFSLIQQKTRKHIRLPFSNGVGNAILKYIEEERPNRQSPYLFLSPWAPHGCLSTGQIAHIASKALNRTSGTHILRKTFASNLLRAGVVYDTVSDALGHESSKTVDPYLSTDSERMRSCSIPLGDAHQYKGGLL